MVNKNIFLKLDMHLHTEDDPVDKNVIKYNNSKLINYLARRGFDGFSVTLHDFMLEDKEMAEVRAYAKSKGLIHIPGIEKTIEKDHILIYNMLRDDAMGINSYKGLEQMLKKYSAKEGGRGKFGKPLVVAAHPFFPSKTAIAEKLERWHGLIDGLEFNSFYPRLDLLDFNQKCIREAAKYQKFLLGNTDAHVLEQIGKTYTILPVPASQLTIRRPGLICKQAELKEFIKNCSEARYDLLNKVVIHNIRHGKPRIKTTPLNLGYIAWYLLNKF